MASPSPDPIQRLAIKGFRDWGSRLSSGGSFRSPEWGRSRSSLEIDWIFFCHFNFPESAVQHTLLYLIRDLGRLFISENFPLLVGLITLWSLIFSKDFILLVVYYIVVADQDVIVYTHYRIQEILYKKWLVENLNFIVVTVTSYFLWRHHHYIKIN